MGESGDTSRNFDGQVDRAVAPLDRRLTDTRTDIAFFALPLFIVTALSIFLTPMTRPVARATVPPMIAYPFHKRFTYRLRVVLGTAFHWVTAMAWSQIEGRAPFVGSY